MKSLYLPVPNFTSKLTETVVKAIYGSHPYEYFEILHPTF